MIHAYESSVARLTACASSGSSRWPAIRSRISLTAVRVKLTSQIAPGSSPSCAIMCATRLHATAVLPVPGPALTSSRASGGASITSRCESSHFTWIEAAACRTTRKFRGGGAAGIHLRVPSSRRRGPARAVRTLDGIVRAGHREDTVCGCRTHPVKSNDGYRRLHPEILSSAKGASTRSAIPNQSEPKRRIGDHREMIVTLLTERIRPAPNYPGSCPTSAMKSRSDTSSGRTTAG